MRLPHANRRSFALLGLPLCAVAFAACGKTVSTTSFKGEQHEVAQTVSNLQADATAGEQKKLCANDIAASVVTKLGGTKGCETAIKAQVAEIDNLEVSIQSISLAPGGATATASVKSTVAGKARPGTISLVKEGKLWKVSAVS
jgi:hypothetical protein